MAALAVLGLIATAFAVGGATAVPDARITVSDVGAAPSEPSVGERVELNLTVSNSGGSPAAAEVTGVRLLDGGETLDEASASGALSAGDSLDATLWTRFDEPGEKRLTVEVVAEQSTADETVTVRRDVVVDVRPAEVALDLRTRALDPEDLRSEEDGENAGGGLGGIEGILGGGGGLDAADDEATSAPAADSPVAVTVVNTGTTTADRVSLTAVGTAVGGDAGGEDAPTVDVGPFVVEDVAPGEERLVIVDLGPLDRRSAVTMTAAFRSGADAPDADGADRVAESTVTYPVREAVPTVADATVRETAGGGVVVDANLGNAGGGEMTGVVVSVGGAPGVDPTPAGGEYFVGTLGASDFVGFELETTANATAAEEIPIRVAYTERGVRYTETLTVAAPSTDDERDAGGAVGRIGGGLGSAVAAGLAVVGLAGALGVAVRTGRVGGSTGRRRDGSAP